MAGYAPTAELARTNLSPLKIRYRGRKINIENRAGGSYAEH